MLIETDAALASFCATLAGEPAVFIDTEFVGEGRYFTRLGSIQLGTPSQAALVDPLVVRDLSPLGAVLANPDIEKVFHAGGQDLIILTRLFGHAVAPVFDTQVAAQLLSGDEQISFDNLVTRIVGRRPKAGHGFTDWLRRPLTPGQIEYALDDVRLLVPVWEAQCQAMVELGREAWLREEFAKLESVERFAPAEPEQQYLRLRGIDRLDGPALAAAQALAAWRERTARDEDMPVARVVRDEVIMELAQRPPRSKSDLRELRGMQPQQASRFGADLLRVAIESRQLPPPPRKQRQNLPARLEPTVDFLGLCLRSLAEERNVAASAVATRGDLIELVLNGEQAEVPLMGGWRREAFGRTLLAALAGQASARITPGSRKVHLEWSPEA